MAVKGLHFAALLACALLGMAHGLQLVSPTAAILKKCYFKWKKPAKLGIKTILVGTTCTWVWADSLAHCVTGRKPNPLKWKGSRQVTRKGFKYSFKFSKVGLYKFTCCVHLAFMSGKLMVVKSAKKKASKVCQPRCHGKCWGDDGCGGSCRFPKKSKHHLTKCKACCKLGRLSATAAVLNDCVSACTKN